MQNKQSFTSYHLLYKNQEGITLIALVVTIAILIILAGVTINVALGKNGILQTTKDFSNEVEEVKEQKNQEVGSLFEESQNVMNDVYAKDAVAQIDSKYYSTLQSAINSVPTANAETTIMLLKDIKENVIIKEQQNIILDLAGKKIENLDDTPVINSSGILSIKNGTIR